MKGLLSAIQRFSLHDGDGIRTTVFMMGCPLHCPWCANPESLICKKREYTDPYGKKGVYGKYYAAKELLSEVLKDMDYYGDDGGVTLSGGEPLLQSQFLEEIVPLLDGNGIGICVETSLFVDSEVVEWVMPYISQLFVDVKILDEKNCAEILGGNITKYMDNLDIILNNKIDNFIMRFPVVKGYTFSQDNLAKVSEILRRMRPKRTEIFSVHNLAAPKYRSLSIPYTNFEVINDEKLCDIKNFLEHNYDGEIVINRI